MVLIVVDHINGILKNTVKELVHAAHLLGLRDAPVVGVVTGGQGAEQAALAATAYIPRVLVADSSSVNQAVHEQRVGEIVLAAERVGASVVLFSSSKATSAVAPRVAVRRAAALLEDVSTLSRSDGVWNAERSAYLNRATLRVKTATCAIVASIKPGAFAESGLLSEAGVVERLPAVVDSVATRVALSDRRGMTNLRVPLDEASIVVCGGRGLGDEESFVKLVEGLADDLGAGVAATRAVVDAGWRPYAEQVGQTGRTVSPDLYIALGVSGAVQHLSGMNRSRVIVAINKDADAPVFKVADYGVVSDVHEFVPALREALASDNNVDR